VLCADMMWHFWRRIPRATSNLASKSTVSRVVFTSPLVNKAHPLRNGLAAQGSVPVAEITIRRLSIFPAFDQIVNRNRKMSVTLLPATLFDVGGLTFAHPTGGWHCRRSLPLQSPEARDFASLHRGLKKLVVRRNPASGQRPLVGRHCTTRTRWLLSLSASACIGGASVGEVPEEEIPTSIRQSRVLNREVQRC